MERNRGRVGCTAAAAAASFNCTVRTSTAIVKQVELARRVVPNRTSNRQTLKLVVYKCNNEHSKHLHNSLCTRGQRALAPHWRATTMNDRLSWRDLHVTA